MKNLRFWWWLVCAFVKKHRRIVLIASLCSIALVSLIPRLAPYLPKFRKPTTIGIVGRYRTVDLPESIAGQVSQGLTMIDSSGQLHPALASEWKIDEAQTTYTLKIDRTKSWHDGTPVSSRDIRLAVENVQTEIPDDDTIIFKLKEPYTPFLAILSRPVLKSGFIGTGPSRVVSVKKNGEYIERITLARGDEQVSYRFYRTGSETTTALKLGEIDVISEATSRKDVPDWEEYELTPTLNYDRYLVVMYNTQDNNLAEKSFRQALTYAIPNKPSGQERALSPINPQSWAYNPLVKPYSTDVQQAKELLESTFKDTELPTLTLTTFLPYLDRAEEIARAWSELGVKTEVKVSTFTPSEFQVLLIGQQSPTDPDQYTLWHSTQETNITRYSSPKVDKLLEDGRKTIDQEKRKEIYRDFQRFLLEDSPAAFLNYITTYTISRKN